MSGRLIFQLRANAEDQTDLLEYCFDHGIGATVKFESSVQASWIFLFQGLKEGGVSVEVLVRGDQRTGQ